MTYTKPNNVTYTEMCIYIDDNIYNGTYNEELVFEYLYHIILMLALKAKLFNRNCYYDGFAIFAASRVFFRLTNKKQFDMNAYGQPKMKWIKSVLNYIKSTLYYLKVDYEQTEYSQTVVPEKEEPYYNYDNVVKSSVWELNLVDFELTMGDIAKTCEKFLERIPYKKTSSEWLNIYTSVILTLMSSMTLRNKSKRRIEHLSSTNRLKDSHIENMFLTEKYDKPVLFHLDPSMSDYITVLSRQLRRVIAKDLSYILHSNFNDDLMMTTNIVKDYVKEQELVDEDKH